MSERWLCSFLDQRASPWATKWKWRSWACWKKMQHFSNSATTSLSRGPGCGRPTRWWTTTTLVSGHMYPTRRLSFFPPVILSTCHGRYGRDNSTAAFLKGVLFLGLTPSFHADPVPLFSVFAPCLPTRPLPRRERPACRRRGQALLPAGSSAEHRAGPRAHPQRVSRVKWSVGGTKPTRSLLLVWIPFLEPRVLSRSYSLAQAPDPKATNQPYYPHRKPRGLHVAFNVKVENADFIVK